MTERNASTQEPNRTLAQTGIPRPSAADCIKAISKPQRRRVLRALHRADKAQIPNELAKTFNLAVSNVSYHVTTLRECRALALTDTQQKRGAIEHFYASTLKDNGVVAMFLEATRAEDEESARHRAGL